MWCGQTAQLTIWRQLEAAALMELPVGVGQLTVRSLRPGTFLCPSQQIWHAVYRNKLAHASKFQGAGKMV